MGIFDALFGKKKNPPTQCSPNSTPPFELIGAAQKAWHDGNKKLADELFLKGIDAYEKQHSDGDDFALGRYGAFLLDDGRNEEAKRILELAIDRNTDIPMIWSDYLKILTDTADVNAFQQAVERWDKITRAPANFEFLLALARRAERAGKLEFSTAIVRWVIERTTGHGNKAGRWAAIGDLGRILEKSGRADDARAFLQKSFNEGSTDPETITRLSMHAEHQKNFQQAIDLIREALARNLPANVEESLRKRFIRCEQKVTGKKKAKDSRPTDVAAYSVRSGADNFTPLFQMRLKPAARSVEIFGSTARCLASSKESSTLIDVDLETGNETQRVDGLPPFDETYLSQTGNGLGIRRTASVGKGPTVLSFFGPDEKITRSGSVPDATSQIAEGPNLWYVGCRDGSLYAFRFDGKLLWDWETPGSRDYQDNVYFRPCPYYVSSQQSFAAVSSMGNIYAISEQGRMLWHQEIPNEQVTRWTFTVPKDGKQNSDDAYQTLGLSPTADSDTIKLAYRRLALDTHPDRHPDDPMATEKFREVQGAYERIISGNAKPGRSNTFSVTVQVQGMGPMASYITSNKAGVLVGSSQGRLYQYNRNGDLSEARVVGRGQVQGTLRADGSIGAVFCDQQLLVFDRGQLVNGFQLKEYPRSLKMLGDDVIVSTKKGIIIFDRNGRISWEVDFSKTISDIAVVGETIVLAAGVLAAFRRNGS